MTGYVLQIDVGIGVSESETRQAMLVTAVNTSPVVLSSAAFGFVFARMGGWE